MKENFQKRNHDGLFDGVQYVYNEDSTINWRRMVKPEYLVPNLERTKETDVSKLSDGEILILLAGIKNLASLRGYSSVTYQVHSCSQEYCCVSCVIEWIPNYETEGRVIRFQSIADAHRGNTEEKMGLNYLASIAENRAFVRCVRNFLKINIIGKDEIKASSHGTEDKSPAPNPKTVLSNLMEEKGVDFKRIKKSLIKHEYEGAERFTSIDDIPTPKVFELITLLKKKKS